MILQSEQDYPQSAVQTAVDYIANKIYSGELGAGDRIPTESELCSVLGISRTSVREAIKTLEAQTVLQAHQGRGTFISQPEDISLSIPLNFKVRLAGISWEEVIKFRWMMEFLLLRELIENATEKDIDDLEELNKDMIRLRLIKPLPVEELNDQERLFHERMLKPVKNRLFKEIYGIVSELFAPLVRALHELNTNGIDETEFPNSHTTYIEVIRKRDIFLAYSVVYNLIPVERWNTLLSGVQYSPVQYVEIPKDE